STAALAMLCRSAGTDQLLLTQPARELRAEITVEPIGTADQRGQIEAVLHLREQLHSITLQRDDGANAQHLAEWVEAAANGTLDTAAAIPQRPQTAPHLMGVPEGWLLVPIEPTTEMREAFHEATERYEEGF